MNLHRIVSGAIGAVNPFVAGTIKVSNGTYTTAPDGKRTPAYNTFPNVQMQVQALTFKDLQQVDGLNLNGTRRAIYMNGRADGVVRSLMKGGDLITLTDGPNAGTWLVAMTLEQFSEWCKVAVTLQNQ
ncbi:MAG: hypothetical protein JWR61_5828 [Ferruginibacter sp.]|uniref:hypothetical protein n=1 Tax=Ferruginibacter sp. TaxID=1940288 RepID=UPI00265B0AC0|nr:hypothetical protein [Ferruginibacter sp.]MDB5280873.1 hypothetical protein [Ferruginibacter sp.]